MEHLKSAAPLAGRFVKRFKSGLRSFGACAALSLILAAPQAAGAQDYVVGVGDKLDISFLGRPDFAKISEVRGDGSIRLHQLGVIDVAGKTLAEVEAEIIERAATRFDGTLSVVAEIAEYRPIFVMGNVENPGSYRFSPGMTVIKAVALAGGYERSLAEGTSERAIFEAQGRAVEARIRLKFIENEQKAIIAELAKIDEGSVELAELTEGSGDHQGVYRSGRAIFQETVEGHRRRSDLADAENGFHSRRQEIISRQLGVIEQQLEDVSGLVAQGLTRRDRLVDLQVNVDNYRADELEALAFAARAEQTGANALSQMGVERNRYHRDLLREKIEIDLRAALMQSRLDTAVDYLRAAAPASAAVVEDVVVTTFEVFRAGKTGAPERVDLTSPMHPEDVLVVTFSGSGSGG